MAKAQAKQDESLDRSEQSVADPLYDMVRAVGDDRLTLAEAVAILRKHVSGLSAEDLEAWKREAVPRARRLMSIAEAFTQEMTVMAAGQ